MRRFVIKCYCHDILVETHVIEAECKENALKQYMLDQSVYSGPEDIMSWPRRGDTLCLDIEEEK